MQAVIIVSYLAVGGLVRLAYEDYKIDNSKVKLKFVESIKKFWNKVVTAFKEAVTAPYHYLF
jgi:hypothetical protein